MTHRITNRTNQSIKSTQIINKLKHILNTLEKNLLNKSISKNATIQNSTSSFKQTTPLDINPTSTITSDSLVSNTNIQTTYSVTSILPILDKTTFQLPYTKSTISVDDEILQIEFDSLNDNHHLSKNKSRIKIRNSARNINSNYQTSDDDESIPQHTRIRSKKVLKHKENMLFYFNYLVYVSSCYCQVHVFVVHVCPTNITCHVSDKSNNNVLLFQWCIE